MLALIALALFPQDSAADLAPAESLVASYVAIDLFKNGEAVVRRELELPGDGVFRLDGDLPHRHGSLRVESAGRIDFVRHGDPGDRAALLEADGGPFDVRAALVGKRVTVRLTDHDTPVSGTLQDAPASILGATYDPVRPYHYNRGPSMVVLETDSGLKLINPQLVESLEVDDATLEGERSRPGVFLHASGFGDEPSRALLEYRAHGITWAPSYALRLTDDGTVSITQYATVRNELADLRDVELRAVTGTPVMEFRTISSPFSADVHLAHFFQSLQQSAQQDPWWWYRPSRRRETSVMSQSVPMSGFAQDALAVPLGPPTEDLQFRSLGRWSLRQGDALHTELARGSTSAERLVDVVIEPLEERYWRGNPGQQSDEERGQAFNCVRFANPLGTALSTGPVDVHDAAGFVCDVELPWTPAGGMVHLRTSRALTIGVDVSERVGPEDPGRGLGDASRRIRGAVQLTNRRDEAARTRVSIQVYGEPLFDSEDESPRPTVKTDATNRRWANPLRTLTWEVELPARGSLSLPFEYRARH